MSDCYLIDWNRYRGPRRGSWGLRPPTQSYLVVANASTGRLLRAGFLSPKRLTSPFGAIGLTADGAFYANNGIGFTSEGPFDRDRLILIEDRYGPVQGPNLDAQLARLMKKGFATSSQAQSLRYLRLSYSRAAFVPALI